MAKAIDGNPRFRERVFTEGEVTYCEGRPKPAQHYAGRFAAKEAVFKALGTGWAKGIGWRQVEVVAGSDGPPTVRLSGAALDRLVALGGRRIHLSITHSTDSAVAFVVIDGDEPPDRQPVAFSSKT